MDRAPPSVKAVSSGRVDVDVSLDRLNRANSGILLYLERPGQLFQKIDLDFRQYVVHDCRPTLPSTAVTCDEDRALHRYYYFYSVLDMFRISHPTHHTIVEVASVAEIENTLRALRTGEYVVCKIKDDIDPSMRKFERQGTATKFPNGSVKTDFDGQQIQAVRT
jgi:hypothetical protein